MLLLLEGWAVRAGHHFFCDRSYKTKMVNQNQAKSISFI